MKQLHGVILALLCLGIGIARAGTFHCEQAVPAFDISNSSKQIGEFKAGSDLEVGDTVASDGMVIAKFKAPDGKVISALCLGSDVGKGGGKAVKGFGASKLYKDVRDSLVAAGGQKLSADRLSHIASSQYVLVYFSAHWCPPCRAFTPKLVEFYNANKSPNLDLIFVSSDESEAKQTEYMNETSMPWSAVQFSEIKGSPLQPLCGPGIPCLVLLDAEGKVVSDSYVGGNYVGPNKVLKDTTDTLAGSKKTPAK